MRQVPRSCPGWSSSASHSYKAALPRCRSNHHYPHQVCATFEHAGCNQQYRAGRRGAAGRAATREPLAHPLGVELHCNLLGQHLLGMAPRGTHKKRDTLVTWQDVAVLVEPHPRHPGERVATECCLRSATQMRRQTALRMIRQIAETQRTHRNALMVEQRALAAIQGTDRRKARRRQAELRPQMLQHADEKDLVRVEH